MLVALGYRATGTTLRVAALQLRKYSIAKEVPVPAPSKSKVFDSIDEAVKDVKSGDVLFVAGGSFFFCVFGFCCVGLMWTFYARIRVGGYPRLVIYTCMFVEEC